MIEESKNVQTTPTRTYCKRNRPLPYYHPKCRTPRHWKFTQDHRTTRPPPLDGAKVLSKLLVPGRLTSLDQSRARAFCTCNRCGWWLFGRFFLVNHFSFLSPSHWEAARYRLKYCLKGPLSPKTTTITVWDSKMAAVTKKSAKHENDNISITA